MSAAIGVGCRAGASAREIVRLVEAARARVGEAAGLHAPDWIDNPALAQAAADLGLPLTRHCEAALLAVAARVVSHSPRVFALHGVGSVAEAAALAGAGPEAGIVLAKFSGDGVSCAAAQP